MKTIKGRSVRTTKTFNQLYNDRYPKLLQSCKEDSIKCPVKGEGFIEGDKVWKDGITTAINI